MPRVSSEVRKSSSAKASRNAADSVCGVDGARLEAATSSPEVRNEVGRRLAMPASPVPKTHDRAYPAPASGARAGDFSQFTSSQGRSAGTENRPHRSTALQWLVARNRQAQLLQPLAEPRGKAGRVLIIAQH